MLKLLVLMYFLICKGKSLKIHKKLKNQLRKLEIWIGEGEEVTHSFQLPKFHRTVAHFPNRRFDFRDLRTFKAHSKP